MRYLHTMIRVANLDRAIAFFQSIGLNELKRHDSTAGRFTLVFMAPPGDESAQVEMTYNWDESDDYSVGRNFGHLAYQVDDIYAQCEKMQSRGIAILRPPRDGRMAFVRSPDNISIEFLQLGDPLPIREPWVSMPNSGEW